MTSIKLANAKRSTKRETVSCATHFRCRSHHIHVADGTQCMLELDQPVGMNTVVICEQNTRHRKSFGLRRLVATLRQFRGTKASATKRCENAQQSTNDLKRVN